MFCFLLYFLIGLVVAHDCTAQNCDDLDVRLYSHSGRNQICEGEREWKLVFKNVGTSPFDLGEPFTITLDDSGDDHVTFEGMEVISGFFNIVSGLNSGEAVIEPSFSLVPGGEAVIIFTVAFSCDLWDEVLGGNGQALEDHQIVVAGFNPNKDCFEEKSEVYDIGYSLVTPNPAVETYPINLGEPFNAQIELAVQSGNFSCDSDMFLFAEFDECVDYSNATIWILDMGYSQSSWMLGADNIEDLGNGLRLNVNLLDGPPPGQPKKACLSDGNYSGAYGSDMNILFSGLVMTCCSDGGAPIEYSTTTCDYDSPSSCFSNGMLETQGGPSTHFVDVPNGGVPDIDLTVNNVDIIEVCDDHQPFIMEFEICNNSTTDPGHAYELEFEYSNTMGLGLTDVEVDDDDVDFVPGSSTLNIDFGITDGSDLEDVDNDGISSELEKDQCITIVLELEYLDGVECLFDGTSCPANINLNAYTARVHWNNQCRTLSPKETQATSRWVRVDSQNGYIDPSEGNLPPVLDEDKDYTVAACFYGMTFTGWNGILEQGDFTQCITATSNYPNVEWGDLIYEGGTISPTGIDNNNYVFPPGVLIEDECVEIDFSFTCEGASGPILLEFLSKGNFDNCPDCSVELSCSRIELYTVCDGDTSSGCDIVTDMNTMIFNAEPDVTTPLGQSRAYPCDEVQMSTTATASINYTGPFQACFLYSDGLPMVFDNYDVSVSIDGTTIAIDNNPTEIGNTYFFNSIGDVNINSGDEIKIVISANVGTDPLPNWVQPLDLLLIGLSFDDEICKQPAQFTILDIEARLESFNSGTCCNGQNRTFRIRYTGGTFGEDFPGNDRIIGRFINSVELEVDQGEINEVRDLVANDVVGVTPATSVTFAASELESRNKNGFTGFAQEFRVAYDPGCGDPNTSLKYDLTWTEHDYSNPSDCYMEHHLVESITSGVTQPEVHVEFIQNFLQVHENTASIDFRVWVTGTDACFPFILVQYVDGVNVTFDGTPVSTSLGECGTDPVFAIQFESLDIGEEITGTLNLEFNIDTCVGVPISIFGSHFCANGALPDPVICPEDLGCIEYSDMALITFLESALTIDGHDCTPDAEQCESHSWSFVVNNPGEGNDYDIGFDVELPVGYTIVGGSFEYPYDGHTENCSGGTALSSADIAAIEAGTWLIPTGDYWSEDDGFLPGLSHGNSTTAERTFHLVLQVIGSCDSEPDQTEITFIVEGERNCGDVISADFVDELNHTLDEFIIPEVNIVLGDDYDCKEGIGVFSFDINFLLDDLDISPDQEFKLFIEPGPGVELFCDSPIIFDYEDQIIECKYEVEGECYDRFNITYKLVTCLEQSCGEEDCEPEVATIATGVYWFNPMNQWISFHEAIFDEEFCNEESTIPSEITTVILNNTAPPGTVVTAQLWCDVDNSGDLSNADVLLTTTVVTLGPPSSETPVSFTMTPNDFHSECDADQVIVTAVSDNQCLCVRDNMGILEDCECVEDITVNFPECITPGEEFCVTYHFEYNGPPVQSVNSWWYIATNVSDPGWTMTSPAPMQNIPVNVGSNSVEVCLIFEGECPSGEGIDLVIRGDMFWPAGGVCCNVRDEQSPTCCCDCELDIEYCTDPETMTTMLDQLVRRQPKTEGERLLIEWAKKEVQKRSPCVEKLCCPICEYPDYQGLVWVDVDCPGGIPDGLTYEWSTGYVGGPMILGTYPNTYSVTVTDLVNDCEYIIEESIICGEGDGGVTKLEVETGKESEITRFSDVHDYFRLSPNPVDQQLSIESSYLPGNRLYIISQYGEVIFSANDIARDRTRLDVSDYVEGVYYAIIRDENGIIQASQKFVVMR